MEPFTSLKAIININFNNFSTKTFPVKIFYKINIFFFFEWPKIQKLTYFCVNTEGYKNHCSTKLCGTNYYPTKGDDFYLKLL